MRFLAALGDLIVCLAAVALGGIHFAEAADPPAADHHSYQQMVAKAIDFLATKGQAEDGSYSAHAGPAITALVATAILRHGRSPDDPLVARSLKYLEKFVQPDGGVYQAESVYKNYETCLAILCLTEANADGRYAKLVNRADAFVKGLQWDEGEGKDASDIYYGGAGYGNKKRPDLSNTQFLIDALKAAGGDTNDEAIKRALVFVSRCQNLETEHNTTPFAAKNPDGGFYYTPAAGGSSMAGETPEGGLRSYGSMTYAGLKSMIYAGVGPDDPRVKAAVKWLRMHYDVKENPGMGAAGLYYYYHTFGKALDTLKEDEFVDEQGIKHDWRSELRAELARRQQANGAWINEADRWMEGDPNLVTGYALLALSYCRPRAARPAGSP
jgi:squalene-hopene/tetraprenyl-beta-curcumene cyclase